MEQLTIAQLFGANATQTASELIIKKSDLADVGLTPDSNNRAEQLVVAILLKALDIFQGTLTDESNQAITDENENPITYDQGDRVSEFLQLLLWEKYIEQRQTLVLRNTIIVHNFLPYEIESFA